MQPVEVEEPIDLVIAPAQGDEFLAIVAPFHRDGGDPRAIGGSLAESLRVATDAEDLYRIETLPRAPSEEEIADIVQVYSPRIMVTGSYDGSDIHATINLRPPRYLPAPETVANGGSTLIPYFDPVEYHVFAPQALDQPLSYVQAWTIGQSYFWQEAYEDALSPLQEAKRLMPRQVPIEERSDMDDFRSSLNWQLGYIAGPVQGNWQAARDLFNEALGQSPQDPAPALGLAASLAQLNDINGAAAILRQSLRNHPDSWQIQFALAEIAAQQGDRAAAFSSYDQAINLLSENLTYAGRLALADIYFNRGYYRLTLDDPAGAILDFEKALEFGRDDIYVHGNLGWAAYLVEDYDTAVRASAAARQLDPQRPDLAFNEALHLLAAGQTDAARVAYQEAIDLTLTFDDTLTRSTYFGVAYNDLADLGERYPRYSPLIQELQNMIDTANG